MTDKGETGWRTGLKSTVEVLRDLTTIIALGGTVVFFISPPFERWIKESFGTKAYYFATELAISADVPEGADKGRIVIKNGANNFYHFLWSSKNTFPGRWVADDKEAVDYFLSVLPKVKGDIVYATRSNQSAPTPGRAEPHVVSAIKTLALFGECFRILDINYRYGEGSYPHNIYLKLVRTPCG